MPKFSEKRIAFAFLLFVLLLQVAALSPELDITGVDLNDNILHFTLAQRVVQAVEAGENPLDCWSAEWSLGYPVLRVYQPLAHLLVAGVYFALGKAVSLMTVFVWMRFLSLALLPLTFFATARLLGLPGLTAAAAALLSPLVSTNFLYGLEFGSFSWAGSGLFPQAVATHFMLLSVGLGYRAMRQGKRLLLAGAMVGLTLACHLIYGYMAAFSLLLAACLPDAAVARRVRLLRTLAMGVCALLASAFQLIPLLADRAVINHSLWEPTWKWDSFGAPQVLRWLFTGDLLDYGRLPVLTLLAAAGAAWLWWNRRRGQSDPAHWFVAAGGLFWILFAFGRPFWGPLLALLGASGDMHLHRVVGGAHAFLILLAAIGLAGVWRELSRRHVAVAVAMTALLLYPMGKERSLQLANDATWGRRNLAAYAAERKDIEALTAEARQRGGRAYSGLAATWGGTFKVGDVPLYGFFSTAGVPAVAFLYHSMALTGDVMVRFNDRIAAHYRLFNIRTVVVPADRPSPLPPELEPRGRFGRFQTYEAPGGGYFDLVDVLGTVKTNRRNSYYINDRWLGSDWPEKRTHLLLDWDGRVPAGIARLDPAGALPFILAPPPSAGTLLQERQTGQRYQADFEVARPAWALFKMTWHPNWKAYVDGAPAAVSMLSPGFPAVQLQAGQHRLEFRYEPGALKTALAIAGLLGLLLLGVSSSRLLPLLSGTPRWLSAPPRGLATAAGLVLLAMPVCLPLFTGAVLWGHDAFSYFPRVVETHQNVIHGIFLARWAPDLGSGYGQPIFLFHPALFYSLAEAWHLAGADFITAVNLACVVIVLASAVAAYRLGSLYFGAAGGWLAAAAYIYAPYFAVDLYVRSSFEEFTAFALFPLALYGFGAWARHGGRWHWALGVAAYAAMLFTHFPAALLFSPLLLGFLILLFWMSPSRRLFVGLGSGLALALGLGACSWAPAILEKQYVAMERAFQGNGAYSVHFVYLHQLLSWAWDYGYSVKGLDDGMSFSLGWSHVLVAAAACIWIARRPQLADRRIVRYFAAAGLVLCFLMLEDALWLWDHLPLLASVQIPWRLLGPVAVCTAVLAGALAPALATLGRWRPPALAACLALLIVPNLSHLHPGRTADVDLAFWTPEQLAVRGFETTTLGETTPRTMPTVPPYNPVAAVVTAGDAVLRWAGRTPFSFSGEVAGKTPSRIRLSLAWFPGWSARIDGQPAEAVAAPGNGQIEVAVPAGTHKVDVVWGRSPIRRTAEIVSLAALLVLLGMVWKWPFSGPAAVPTEDAAYSTPSS